MIRSFHMLTGSTSGAQSGGAQSSEPLWLVTLTDLVGLMLAFFVMMFSMGTVEEGRWQRVAGAMSNGPVEATAGGQSPPRADVNAAPQPIVAGRNLDYLAALLEQRLAAAAMKDSAKIEREEGRIAIRIDPTAQAEVEKTISDLAAILRPLPNSIAVESEAASGAADPAVLSEHWLAALARSVEAARLLAAAGYGRSAEVLVRVGADGRDSAIRIVVRESVEN